MHIDRLKQAALRAEVLSRKEDRLVQIKVRSYGYLVEGQREVGDSMRRSARQTTWEMVDQARLNILLATVDAVNDELGKD